MVDVPENRVVFCLPPIFIPRMIFLRRGLISSWTKMMSLPSSELDDVS